MVVKVAKQYKLTERLYAVTADNASNNATLRRALESMLSKMGITWRANEMTVNCLAHVLNLSAKAQLQGLKLVDDTDTSNEDVLDEGLSEDEDDLDDDLSQGKDKLDEDESPGLDYKLGDNDNKVAVTVRKVRLILLPSTHFVLLMSSRFGGWLSA